MLMQSVFLVAGIWDYKVLSGNILGYIAVVGNFFLMGLTVQKALTKDEKEAKQLIKLSQILRLYRNVSQSDFQLASADVY